MSAGLSLAIAPLPAADSSTEIDPDDGAIPHFAGAETFTALVESPPFSRSLGSHDNLILTGLAAVGGDTVATLLDTRTMQSQIVSQTANAEGWLLVGVGGDPDDAETWTARIQMQGGEVVSIRYQKPPPPRSATSGSRSSSRGSSSSSGQGGPLSSQQLSEAHHAAKHYKEGFSADGYKDAPPPEMVAKLSRLNTTQREEINRQMLNYRNQGLGMPERRKIYEGLVDRAVQTR
ncbi:MAG: hypothetical protein KDK99_00645 [Verrucomicrobiales bacterium]|nr:hypothetical protein [Verrucomicrobiales bacterium]